MAESNRAFEVTTQFQQRLATQQLLDQILGYESHASIAGVSAVTSPQAAFCRDKLFLNIRLLRGRLIDTDPAFLSVNGLRSVGEHLQGILNTLQVIQPSVAEQSLVACCFVLEDAVYPRLPAAFLDLGVAQAPLEGAFAAAVQSIRQFAVAEAQTLLTQVDEYKRVMQAQVDAASKGEAETRERLAALAVEIGQHATALAAQSASNAAAISEMRQSAAESEAQRVERFSNFIEQAKVDTGGAISLVESESRSLIDRLIDSDKQATTLVAAIGAKGITANYKVIAGSEAATADRWRNVTIGILGVGMLVAITVFGMFLHDGVEHVNYPAVLVRLAFAIAVTAPAIYTARESARHRTIADRARQAEMELASLGPFIANLSPDTQDSIRRDLVAKYFGRIVEAHTAEPVVKFKDVSDLAVELVKATHDKKK